MIAAATTAAEESEWWTSPGIVAALVSAVVALVTIGLNQRAARKDRQRQLFGDAIALVQDYKEYPYRVRRRRSDGEAADADRSRLTNDLSHIQSKLAAMQARLLVEAPRVGGEYVNLVGEVRSIAGSEIRRSWRLPAVDGDAVSITDIDLSAIRPSESRFLDATRDHLALCPTLLCVAGRGSWRAIKKAVMVRGRSRALGLRPERRPKL